MDESTIDETIDEPTTDDTPEEVQPEEEASSVTIDLPLDHDGTPVHVGDYVLVRGRSDINVVISMTTDGGDDDTVAGDGLNGWTLHVRQMCPQRNGNEMRNCRSHDVKVLELTPEEEMLIEFYGETMEIGFLKYQTCKDYSGLITVNEL